ncbi:MAG: hypothetical protein D6705_01770 [Deltaproteobacteria bacterium]|nr:MAG: hypothetical protein D6705_01770 [Deltaproteobacteria bacterium]
MPTEEDADRREAAAAFAAARARLREIDRVLAREVLRGPAELLVVAVAFVVGIYVGAAIESHTRLRLSGTYRGAAVVLGVMGIVWAAGHRVVRRLLPPVEGDEAKRLRAERRRVRGRLYAAAKAARHRWAFAYHPRLAGHRRELAWLLVLALVVAAAATAELLGWMP